MPLHSDTELVAPPPDLALLFRRQIRVSGLFKYVAETQELEDGFAFKFRRSELLIRRIADYIVFEGQHSPHLTFVLVAEPNGSVLWIQVRGPESEKEYIRTLYTTLQPRMLPLA
jgi:lipocalin